MGKKIVVVNAGPRMGWNTETLIWCAVRLACRQRIERTDRSEKEE